MSFVFCFFFFKQKTAYEMRISDWSSDVCSSDLSSKTYLIGTVSSAAKRMVRVAQEAMWKGIGQVRPGAHIGAIGFAIERHAKKDGYSVVREFCGHEIGRASCRERVLQYV